MARSSARLSIARPLLNFEGCRNEDVLGHTLCHTPAAEGNTYNYRLWVTDADRALHCLGGPERQAYIRAELERGNTYWNIMAAT